jgi:hypothetical protein
VEEFIRSGGYRPPVRGQDGEAMNGEHPLVTLSRLAKSHAPQRWASAPAAASPWPALLTEAERAQINARNEAINRELRARLWSHNQQRRAIEAEKARQVEINVAAARKRLAHEPRL